MTYEEKVAALERLKAEIAGRPQILGSWDATPSTVQDYDDFQGADAPRVHVPLVIDEAEAQRLFPKGQYVEQIAPGTCMGRKGLPDSYVKMMYRCYKRGRSLQEVGRIFGRSRQAVHEIFKRCGFELRKDSKARAKIELAYAGLNYAPGKNGYLRATTGSRGVLQHAIWEEFHGPVPAGHQVRFRDGNKRNVEITNLECVPRSEVLERGRAMRRAA